MQENTEFENIKNEQEKGVVMYDAKKISKTFHVNVNKATDFLKKFGCRIGHWQIEQNKLLKILSENDGILF